LGEESPQHRLVVHDEDNGPLACLGHAPTPCCPLLLIAYLTARSWFLRSTRPAAGSRDRSRKVLLVLWNDRTIPEIEVMGA
jgi:hypothetical protein